MPRITVVQYGNFSYALDALDRGEPEAYQCQAYCVAYWRRIARTHPLTVIQLADGPFDVTHDDGRIRGIAMRLWDQTRPPDVIRALADSKPELVVCFTPLTPVLAWCDNRGIPCLPIFADYIRQPGLRKRGGAREFYRNWLLGRTLRSAHFPLVCNHNLTASRSLRLLGLQDDVIVPWDNPPTIEPRPPKTAPRGLREGQGFSILFVGSVTEDKGVGDAIRALAVIRQRKLGWECSLSIAGWGAFDEMNALATSLGVADLVTALGKVPQQRVGELMTQHDACIVPSRHSYPEGLPFAVFEALASGSPLIASDHPVFENRIVDGETAAIFKAADPDSLADTLVRLGQDRALYARLSAAGAHAYRSLFIGIEWASLMDAFIADPRGNSGWIRDHTLSTIEPRLAAARRAASPRVAPSAQAPRPSLTAG